MNAQEKWKHTWKQRHLYKIPDGRFWLKQDRREAALERIVARQQRTIEAQAREIERMQTVIDDLDGFSGSFAATMLLNNRDEYKP